LPSKKGKSLVYSGSNGAGKSTTIRMIITLTEASQGEIEVAGYDVKNTAIR
jgi:ABC-2 type transport system ATP-binding protein